MSRLKDIIQHWQWRLGHLWDYQYVLLARHYSLPGGFKRIYHYHIRKTGGTSLNRMFFALSGENSEVVKRRITQSGWSRTVSQNKAFVGWNKDLIEQGLYYYAFSHIPAHELRLPEDTFTFTCLRDPVARVISHYKMLYGHRATGRQHPMMAKEGAWLGKDFREFLTLMPKEHLLRQLYMFSSNFSIDEAYSRIVGCSQIILLEDFAKGVNDLAAKLQIALHPIHAKKSTSHPSIGLEDIRHLRTLLDDEYQLYARVKTFQLQNQADQ